MYYKHTLLFSWKLLYNTLIDERSEANKCAVRMFIAEREARQGIVQRGVEI